MSNYAKLRELDIKVRDIKNADRNADVTGILQTALRKTEGLDEKLYILSRLASEFQLLRRPKEAEGAIKDQIALDPNKPESWLLLATLYFRYTEDLPSALSAVEVAIEKAAKEGNFVRQAHAERIRIALATKNYEIVESSLMTLIEYVPKPGSIDVELEYDFLPRIPDRGVRNDLIEKYRTLAQPH